MSETITADPYWSRTSSDWEAIERADPVIWEPESELASDALSAEQLAHFEQAGYLQQSPLFSADEAADLLSAAQQLAREADVSRPDVIAEPTSQVVRSLFRVHRTSDIFRRVAQDPRLVEWARRILGSDVYLHQSRINFKPAFDGKEFFWHSDFETWHIEDGMPRMRAVSVSVALTDNNEFNGPLMVIPQSHRTYIRCVGETPDHHFEKSLKKQEYGVPSREAMELLVERGGITAPKGPAGSALFFDCNLMHGSAGNISPFPRTNLFMVYNSVDNRLTDPFGGTPPRPEFLGERDVVPDDDL